MHGSAVGGRYSIREDELVAFVKSSYAHQALSKDQILVADFNGISIALVRLSSRLHL